MGVLKKFNVSSRFVKSQKNDRGCQCLSRRGKDGFGLACLAEVAFDGTTNNRVERWLLTGTSVEQIVIECQFRWIRITMIRGENNNQELKNRNQNALVMIVSNIRYLFFDDRE